MLYNHIPVYHRIFNVTYICQNRKLKKWGIYTADDTNEYKDYRTDAKRTQVKSI